MTSGLCRGCGRISSQVHAPHGTSLEVPDPSADAEAGQRYRCGRHAARCGTQCLWARNAPCWSAHDRAVLEAGAHRTASWVSALAPDDRGSCLFHNRSRTVSHIQDNLSALQDHAEVAEGPHRPVASQHQSHNRPAGSAERQHRCACCLIGHVVHEYATCHGNRTHIYWGKPNRAVASQLQATMQTRSRRSSSTTSSRSRRRCSSITGSTAAPPCPRRMPRRRPATGYTAARQRRRTQGSRRLLAPASCSRPNTSAAPP